MKRIIIASLVLLLILLSLSVYYYRHTKETSNILILYGNVDVRQVDLGFQVSGRVDYMPFEEGDYVPQGALVSTIDKQPYLDQVRQAAATLEATKTSLENAQKILQRRESLIGTGGVSQEDFDNALSSRDVLQANVQQGDATLGVALTNLLYTEVFCPTDSIVLTRIREPGTVVKVADPVYTLSILSPVWIRAFVAEPYLGLVYPGMPAEVFTDTEGGPSYQAFVGFISPVAEFTPKTVETTQLRTDLVYRLRIYCSNPDRGLRQGMPVTVKLKLDKAG